MLSEMASVPSGLHHERFVATPLTMATAEMDHAAYMTSPEVILTHSDGRWPTVGFTLADDLELVARHEADHRRRRAFTFTLLAPTLDRAVGCLYVNPLHTYLRRCGAGDDLREAVPQAAAMITFWVRQDEQETGLPLVVADAVNDWLLTAWPLPTHYFRVLPDEHSSCAALDRLDLRRRHLPLPDEPRHYRWYQPADG